MPNEVVRGQDTVQRYEAYPPCELQLGGRGTALKTIFLLNLL